MEKIVDALGSFFESNWGFIGTTFAWLTGLAVGIVIGSFAESQYVDVFNLCLSLSALFISSLILVAGKKNSVAMMALIEELIKSQKGARNELLGLEKESMKDIEEVKEEIEKNAPGT
jgi:low affinity Fe/Cu permease